MLFLLPPASVSISLAPPHLHFCWLLWTINISCVTWLFWIVWAHGYACACPYTRWHVCLCISVRLPIFVCVSVPQYQILLSQLSASLSLVVICLSNSQPSTSPSVWLSFFLSTEFFYLHPSVAPSLSSSPLPCCFLCDIILPLPWCRPACLPLNYSTSFFLLLYLQPLASLSPFSHSLLNYILDFFYIHMNSGFHFRKNNACKYQMWWNTSQKWCFDWNTFYGYSCLFNARMMFLYWFFFSFCKLLVSGTLKMDIVHESINSGDLWYLQWDSPQLDVNLLLWLVGWQCALSGSWWTSVRRVRQQQSDSLILNRSDM